MSRSSTPQAMPAPAHGEGRETCGAKTRTGKPCGRPAGSGTGHLGVGCCKLHGGSTRNHRRAASKELARREVQRLGLERGQEPTRVGPAEALLRALWHAHEDMATYAQLVHELDIHPALGEDGNPSESALYAPTVHLTGEPTGEAKRHVLVQLYEDAQRRVADIGAACLRAKVAEEQVRLAQQHSQFLVAAMQNFAAAIGSSVADPAVRAAMRASIEQARKELGR